MRTEAAIILTLALSGASFHDLRERRIPNAITGCAAVLLLGVASTGGPVAVANNVAMALLVGAAPGVLHLIDGDAMGGGDVKLAVVIGLAEGQFGLVALVVGCCLGLCWVWVSRVFGRRLLEVPLAPFLSAGALAGGLMA